MKIHCFRMELGQIETHLLAHLCVREVLVQIHEVGSDTRLLTYAVTNTDTLLTQNLRSYQSTLLPDYTVPAVYVRLPSLPLILNRKLGRRSPPAPDDEASVCQHYGAPQNEIVKNLAGIWCELLDVEHISRHYLLFALGGHSLSVVLLMA